MALCDGVCWVLYPRRSNRYPLILLATVRRFDSNTGSNGGSSSGGYDSPKSIESQLVRREGSMHLPRPAECQVQGTHSDMCIVRVRRNHLLEDALDEIARQYRCVHGGSWQRFC